MKAFYAIMLFLISSMCYSDTWNDEDGKIVFLCIGNSDESDRQTDCFYQVDVEVKYRNDGYVRVISYEVSNSKFA